MQARCDEGGNDEIRMIPQSRAVAGTTGAARGENVRSGFRVTEGIVLVLVLDPEFAPRTGARTNPDEFPERMMKGLRVRASARGFAYVRTGAASIH
jgi:hypothetical protein